MREGYISIGPFPVDNASTTSNLTVDGLPGMTAFGGFVHALQRHVRQQGYAISFDGVAPIIHEFSRIEGHPRLPSDARRSSEKMSSRVIDTRLCRLRVSLLVPVSVPEGKEADLDRFLDNRQEIIRDFLLNARLAGGSIFLSSGCVFNWLPRWEDVTGHLRKLRYGWFIKDRRDLIASGMAEGNDPLEVMLEHLKVSKEQNPGKGWIVPLAVGFQAIETPELRPSHRNPSQSYPFAWAEGISGLAELIPLSRLIFSDEPIEGVTWRHHSYPDTHTYVMAATSAAA